MRYFFYKMVCISNKLVKMEKIAVFHRIKIILRHGFQVVYMEETVTPHNGKKHDDKTSEDKVASPKVPQNISIMLISV